MTSETNLKDPSMQNDAIVKSKDYQHALDLAETGRHDEALSFIKEYLISSPNDAEAMNDTGAILHCLGRSDEAIDLLLKARKLQPDSSEIIWNLSESYLAAGKATEAMGLFDEMDRIGVLNADVLNRTADVFLNENNLSDAVKMLNRSLELWPEQKNLVPMIEMICHKMAEDNCE